MLRKNLILGPELENNQDQSGHKLDRNPAVQRSPALSEFLARMPSLIFIKNFSAPYG